MGLASVSWCFVHLKPMIQEVLLDVAFFAQDGVPSFSAPPSTLHIGDVFWIAISSRLVTLSFSPLESGALPPWVPCGFFFCLSNLTRMNACGHVVVFVSAGSLFSGICLLPFRSWCCFLILLGKSTMFLRCGLSGFILEEFFSLSPPLIL